MNSNRHHYSRLALGMALIALVTIPVIPVFRSQAQSVLGIRLTPTVSITGAIGSWQQIQYSDDLANPTNWTMLSNLVLTHSPTTFSDLSSNAPRRFYRSITLTNVLNTNMVWIPPGTFLMGSPTNEVGRNPTNENQATVTLTRGFFMSKFEVTRLEYVSVIGSYPVHFNSIGKTNDNHAMDSVQWDEATNYCTQLTLRDLALFRIPPGWAYRLPTEAEWEYACRAGTTTVFHYGNALYNDTIVGSLASFDGDYPYPPIPAIDPNGIHPTSVVVVGSYQPNAFELYDMHGNIAEWCLDGTGPSSNNLPPPALPYAGGSVTNPLGTGDTFKIIRGGSYNSTGVQCRSAYRAGNAYNFISAQPFGFRVILAPVAP